jgi:hypothetical protein
MTGEKTPVVRELFIEELAGIHGGSDPELLPCPEITSLACGEEQFPCSLC